jgi:hypothetical protein
MAQSGRETLSFPVHDLFKRPFARGVDELEIDKLLIGSRSVQN